MNTFAATEERVRRRPARAAPWRGGDDTSVLRAVAKFAISAFLAVVLVGLGSALVVRHVAREEAVREAREFARLAGRGIAAPLVTPAVLRGDPEAVARLDRAVRSQILGGGVVRVKIWTAGGRVVYSDARALIGARYTLPAEDLEALQTRGVQAEASDLSRPENRLERQYRRLVEVYLSVRATDGTPLLFETYERSASISASGRRRLAALAPALIGALVLLELLIVPLAWSMARRLRDRQRERESLLRNAIESSDLERRRVAADLHDGPLQRLAGLSFTLSAEAESVDAASAPAAATALRSGATETRRTIRELRALLVEIYPPSLRDAGLGAAIEDLTAPLAARGIAVTVDVPPGLDLREDIEALLFRTAQEALRNVNRHAEPERVSVVARRDGPLARLVVADDGRGFDAEGDGPTGHFGLRLMQDLARSADGRLWIEAEPGAGTRVTLEVPA